MQWTNGRKKEVWVLEMSTAGDNYELWWMWERGGKSERVLVEDYYLVLQLKFKRR